MFVEPRMIKYCGRRILCHEDFRLYLATPMSHPKFSSIVASSTTLINYSSSNETLVDDLLTRAFARVRPDLYVERRLALKNVYQLTNIVLQIQEMSGEKLDMEEARSRKEVLPEKNVEFIAQLTTKKNLVRLNL